MRLQTRILWFLLFLSPAIGELLSGSCPPLQFFNPVGLLIQVLFYGCGTVLIREARARWHLQWPVIFLAVAYAIWEEGTTTQSFFNPNHAGLGVLTGYGMWGGIQWPWAIEMILYHSTMSTLVPIAIVDLLWPEYRYVPLLRRRGIVFSMFGNVMAAAALMLFVLSQEKAKEHPYQPDPGMVIGSVVVVGLLIFLAYQFRNQVVATHKIPLFPPFVFAIAGFVFQAGNLLLPNGMAEAKIPAERTLAVQLAGVAAALAFVFFEVFHQRRTTRHLVSLVIGLAFFFILVTVLHEFGQTGGSRRGMLAVGIVSLVLLILWRRRVLKGGIARQRAEEPKDDAVQVTAETDLEAG